MPKPRSVPQKLTLIPLNPNNAPAVLTYAGWQAVADARQVALRVREFEPWRQALLDAGVSEEAIVDLGSKTRAEGIENFKNWLAEVNDSEATRSVLWLAETAHEFLASPEETWEAAETSGFELTVLEASPAKAGAEVIEAVRVMERLHSEQGDPWSWEQSHGSLARYLLEETHEVLELLDQIDEVADPKARAEMNQVLTSEFGDLLFQLIFHARTSRRGPALPGETAGFSLDEIVVALNQKMYHRNPHVFGEGEHQRLSIAEIIEQYEAAKAAEKESAAKEKAESTGALKAQAQDLARGIPNTLPALQKAFKIAYRAKVAGSFAQLEAAVLADTGSENPQIRLAAQIMQLVLAAVEPDLDPESALRSRLGAWLGAVGSQIAD